MHGTPRAYHWQPFGSAVHDAWSVWFEHGSVDVVPPPLPLVPPVGAGTAPPEPQPQAHGGQSVPGAQLGQLQVQVPLSTQPDPPPPPGSQLQSQGGQVSPGAQSGQAQVHVPPPLPPPEQSHSGGGHGALGAHAIGVTHAQPPPVGSFG